MYVKMTKTLAGHPCPRRKGCIYDVDEAEGEELIRAGVAEKSDVPPPHIAEVLDRLEHGAGRPTLFLPFVGEFGHLIMSHLRMVYFHRASHKIVCCRPGEQALFPNADAFFHDWVDPIPDKVRAGTLRDRDIPWPDIIERFPDHVPWPSGRFTLEQELFLLHPDEPIQFNPKRRGLKADVVLSPRNREFCPAKNSGPQFEYIARELAKAGYTVATMGGRETAQDLPGQVYHTRGDCDAAIELLQNCRLYIGTDSGGSHLASTVGAPMLIFREQITHSRDFVPRMQRLNAGRCDYMRGPKPWDHPQLVVERAIEHLESGFGTEPRSLNYVAQHDEDRWMARNWDHLGLPERGFFVEVGAADGRTHSNTFWLAKDKGWRGLLIEPDPRQTAKIETNRPESIVEVCAAGDRCGTAQYGLMGEPSLSGLLRSSGQQVEVRIETLTALLDRHDIDRVDVLSIDTEGTELDVWAGLDLKRWRPRLVIIEWNTVDLPSKRQAIIERLRADGYMDAAELGGNLLFRLVEEVAG